MKKLLLYPLAITSLLVSIQSLLGASNNNLRDQARFLVGQYYNGDLSLHRTTEEKIKNEIIKGGLPLFNRPYA